jgi:hypothetical protein
MLIILRQWQWENIAVLRQGWDRQNEGHHADQNLIF